MNDIYNYLATYSPGGGTATTQEWEMANEVHNDFCCGSGCVHGAVEKQNHGRNECE